MALLGRHRRAALVAGGALLAAAALGLLVSTLRVGSAAEPSRSVPVPSAPGPPSPTASGRAGPTGVVTAGGGSRPTGGGPILPVGGFGFDSFEPGIGRGWELIIPAIDVDASVIDLGLNGDGSLEVPTDFDLTGWYSLGPRPGDVGPAVIVGHVDSRSGAAVFYRLREMEPGDTVKVDRGKQAFTFVVTSVGQYPKSDFPTDKVYGRVDVPALRLITCGGVFDSLIGHYTDNVVVFAELAA